MSGWIKLHRTSLDCPELERFDEQGVWDKLLMMAAREPRTVRLRGQVVRLERGQAAVVVTEFANRGGVTRKRLRTILGSFGAKGMIETGQAKGHAFTIITICNYGAYQLGETVEGQVNGHPFPDHGPSKGQARAKLGPTEQEVGESKNLETESLLATTEPPTRAHTREEPAPAGPVVATNSLLLIGSKEGCSEAEADHRWRRIVTAAEGDEALAGFAVDLAYHETPLGVPLTKYAIGVCRRQIIQERAQIKAALDRQTSVPSEMERQYQASMQVLYDAGYVPPERRH